MEINITLWASILYLGNSAVFTASEMESAHTNALQLSLLKIKNVNG